MELYQIRAFVAVAELGHLTRAAERLHVSQPALSGQIKALESQLELKLFERAPSGMVLTAAGRQLFPRALEALAAADDFRHAATRLSGQVSGTLRVGTVSDPKSVRLALLAAALRVHPRLELAVSHQVSGEALESVRQGRLDASYYFGDRPADDIAALEARQDRLSHRRAGHVVASPDRRRVVDPRVRSLGADAADQHLSRAAHHPVRAAWAAVAGALRRSRRRDRHHEPRRFRGRRVAAAQESALELERAGTARIWGGTRVVSTLWFIALAARRDDPLIKATFELVSDSWQSEAANDRLAIA